MRPLLASLAPLAVWLAPFVVSGCQNEDGSHAAESMDPAALKIEDAAEEAFVPVEGDQSEKAGASLTGRLRAAHSLADAAQSGKQVEAALVELEQLFALTKDEAGPHMLAVRQDLAARIATFKLQTSDLPGAVKTVHEGLSLTDRPTLLRANLFIVLADIEEAQDNKEAASDALMSALTINQHLFNAELESP